MSEERKHTPGPWAVAAAQLREARLAYDALAAQNAELVEALHSIAGNTCCASCQEAALVARAALSRATPNTDSTGSAGSTTHTTEQL